MKTKWLLLVGVCFGCFSCSNPVKENTVPDANLSALERADIALLAAHFSSRNIDSIWAGPTVYYGHGVPVQPGPRENDFTGHVTFDSMYTDTDKISCQGLQFSNKYWYSYSGHVLPDSEMVFVNDWYSYPGYFGTVEKTVFKIDTLIIFATVSGVLNKTAIVGYLNTIYAMMADSADTSYKRFLTDFSVARVASISSSAIQDTTFLDLNYGDFFFTYRTYQFWFLGSVFIHVVVFGIAF